LNFESLEDFIIFYLRLNEWKYNLEILEYRTRKLKQQRQRFFLRKAALSNKRLHQNLPRARFLIIFKLFERGKSGYAQSVSGRPSYTPIERIKFVLLTEIIIVLWAFTILSLLKDKESFIKKISLCFLFLFVFSIKAFSQNKWEIKGGPNYTYFDDAKSSSPKVGLSLGVARIFKLNNYFSISGEVNFVTKGAILEQRAVIPYAVEKQNSYSWDIHGFIGYLELPLFIEYSFPISNIYELTLFMGPSYSIPMLDFTKFNKKDFIEVYDPNNPSGMNYDYNFEQESGFGNNTSRFIFNLGFDVSFTNYFIELRYVLDNREFYNFNNLSEVSEKLNSFYILFGIKL